VNLENASSESFSLKLNDNLAAYFSGMNLTPALTPSDPRPKHRQVIHWTKVKDVVLKAVLPRVTMKY